MKALGIALCGLLLTVAPAAPSPEGHKVNASSDVEMIGWREKCGGRCFGSCSASGIRSRRFGTVSARPDTYDHRGDSYRTLRSDYDSAVDNLEGQMDDLDSKIDDVQISCHYPFSVNRLSPIQASERRLADAIKDSAGPTNRPIPE